VGDDEYGDYLARLGPPPTVRRQLVELYVDFRGAWAGTPTPTLATLAGYAPMAGLDAVNRRVAVFPAG
jgi:NAD(P)H dehydrogenase (quinone)